jgi:hypothetical protein
MRCSDESEAIEYVRATLKRFRKREFLSSVATVIVSRPDLKEPNHWHSSSITGRVNVIRNTFEWVQLPSEIFWKSCQRISKRSLSKDFCQISQGKSAKEKLEEMPG